MGRNTVRKLIRNDGVRNRLRKIRRGKVTEDMKKFIIEKARNKWSASDRASVRLIADEVNNTFNTNIYFSTIQLILVKEFSIYLQANHNI